MKNEKWTLTTFRKQKSPDAWLGAWKDTGPPAKEYSGQHVENAHLRVEQSEDGVAKLMTVEPMPITVATGA